MSTRDVRPGPKLLSEFAQMIFGGMAVGLLIAVAIIWTFS